MDRMCESGWRVNRNRVYTERDGLRGIIDRM